MRQVVSDRISAGDPVLERLEARSRPLEQHDDHTGYGYQDEDGIRGAKPRPGGAGADDLRTGARVSPSLSADPTAIDPTTIGTSLNSPTVPRTSMTPPAARTP